MKKTTILFCVVVLSLMQFACPSGAAEYPHLNWLSRVRAAAAPGQLLLMSSYVAVSGEKNALYVFDRETGARWWSFGFGGPMLMFPGAGDTIFVLSDHILHRLNVRSRERIWSLNAGPSEGITVVFDPTTDITIVRDTARHCIAVESDGATRTCPDTAPENGNVPVDFDAVPSEIVAPETRFAVEDRAAVLYDTAGRVIWRAEFNAVLAKTAARLKDSLYIIKIDGTLVSLDPRSGKKNGESDLKQIIHMKMWDELPEDIDNYTSARMEAVDGHIYLSVNSAIARLSLLAFPTEMSLKPGSQSTVEWALSKALEKWDARDAAGALEAFRTVADAYPDSAEAQMFLGMAYASMRHPEESVRVLENAIRLDPANPDIANNLAGNCIARAMSFNPKTDMDKIVEYYEKAISVQPEVAVSYISLAELYLGYNRGADAEKVLLQADKAGFFGEDIYLLAVSALYVEKKYDEALALSAQASGLFPSSRLLRIIRSKCYFDMGQYGNAVKELQTWTMVSDPGENTTFPQVLAAGDDYVLGTSLGMMGKYDDSRKALERQLKKIPTRADVESQRMELKNLLAASKNKEDEARAREKGKNLVSSQAQIEYTAPTLLSLARFAIASADSKSAAEWCSRLIDVYEASSIKDPMLASDIGYMLALAGVQTATAERYISESYAAQPDNPLMMKNQAMFLWKIKGDFFAAEDLYKKTIAVQEKSEYLHYDYALMLLAQGHRDEAAHQFRLESQVSPESVAGREGLKLLEPQKAPPKPRNKPQVKKAKPAASKQPAKASAKPAPNDKKTVVDKKQSGKQ